ncbi:MAG: TolC family protein [Planctomycetes bacterium]|nr:TolC family protein [Planctomycetota bacterium]
MFNSIKYTWRLAIVTQLTFCCGCLSTGSRVAETRDPFLEPSSPQPAMLAAPANSPALTPLPSVEEPARVRMAGSPTVQLMAYEQEDSATKTEVLQNPLAMQIEPIAADKTLAVEQAQSLSVASMAPTVIESGVYPIDLANALGLGGADNLQVRLARTRLFQAQARHLEAKTLWLPSIRLGVGYNKHDGRLQETEGNVIEVERNSLFYGGGFGLGDAPLAGGAGGPPRMFVNLSLADAYFKPLAACQEVAAQGAAERVASNDSLAEIAISYHSLLEAHGQLANAVDAREMTEEMVGLVEDFEREGFSSQAEVSRARTALGRWRRDVADAERQTVTTSAKLARVLRLPAQVQLVPVEEFLMPIDIVDGVQDLDALIADAWHRRPEISQLVAFREAAGFRVKEEKWRPWIPNVQVGASAGGFGGGTSTNFPSPSDRSDVDLIAVWEMKNMGMGNVARQRLRRGELHERVLEIEALRDRIAAEVVAAAADVASYRRQSEIAQEAIAAAEQSYRLNEQRIRESEGLPIELLQSISALAEARIAYTEIVANYNRSQYRLLRALGNPADVP